MQIKDKGHQRRSESFWREVVRCWKRSGKSQAAFCQKQGIALSTFTYWYKRLRQEPSAAVFYPVVVSSREHISQSEPPAPLRLVFADKRLSIEIPGDFSEPVLRKLIITLEALP